MKNLCAFLLSCLVCGLALSCKKDNTATTTNNTTSKVNLLPADSAAGFITFMLPIPCRVAHITTADGILLLILTLPIMRKTH